MWIFVLIIFLFLLIMDPIWTIGLVVAVILGIIGQAVYESWKGKNSEDSSNSEPQNQHNCNSGSNSRNARRYIEDEEDDASFDRNYNGIDDILE